MEHVPSPPSQGETNVAAVGDGILELASPPVGFLSYLVFGAECASLIDTGMGVGSLRQNVEKLTSLPVFVINTHGHPDHCGGNFEFSETYINPADNDVFEKMANLDFRRQDIAHMPGGAALAAELQPTAPRPAPLTDGQELDLGGRMLRILFAPGHTHGSLCVYDETTGSLFTGDNVMRRVSLHEWNSSPLSVYRETLQKLIGLRPVQLLGGHRPNVNGPELLDTLLRLTDRALGGETGELRDQRGVMAYVLEEDGVTLDFTEEYRR